MKEPIVIGDVVKCISTMKICSGWHISLNNKYIVLKCIYYSDFTIIHILNDDGFVDAWTYDAWFEKI